MKKAFHILAKPFWEDLAFFLSLWCLVSFADLYYWTSFHDIKLALIKIVYGFIATYLAVLFAGFFNGKVKCCLQVVLWAFGIVNLFADAFVHHSFHTDLSDDMIAILYGTNPEESKEFLSMYFPPSLWLIIICGLVASIVIYLLTRKEKHLIKNTLITTVLFVLLVTGTVVILAHSWNYGRTIYLNKIGMLLSYKKPAPFRDKRPLVKADHNILDGPQHIVLIMGESMNKSHCSLYGYQKQTTPRLDSLVQGGILFEFNQITSPAAITIESFKYMMTLYDHTSEGEFWEYPFLLDIMKASGYQTVWISNQSSAGLADNVVARFAELSDTTIWVGTKGMGQLKVDLDEEVIPVIDRMKPIIEDKPCFWFVHLMGSHEAFYTRYPSSFDHFKQDDYLDKPQKDRWLWSSYDNSLLYTDYVVTEIMQRFKDDNALVFYFPDHGMDIYESDPTYAGHAKPNDNQSFAAATQIPLIIFPTASYAAIHPDKLEMIANSANLPFNTEDISKKIMELAIISLKEE